MERKPSILADPRIKKKSYSLSASDYKLLEEIGKGVSAFVYRARCIPLNEFIAIKALNLDGCDSNNLDNIRREVQTMSLISHPNVVKAYCSFMVEKSLWVVMPFMAGGSCLHIMKAAYPDGFEEPITASFLKETLKGLEYLHHQGYIHRDVKAGNILVDGNGVIKLGDFGVSACMFETWDRQRSRNTFAGTPCWMAPEVMEQVHGYDFKADIWSFGITALELAHGHAPFSKYPPVKVLLMTLQNAPPGFDYEKDKRFSKAFKEMVAMCLVKDPSKRPSAEKLLKHSFFKHAKTADYICRTILDPLPPLWERVQDVKMRDEARLAEKKMPYGEQEARSLNEYKRGVSSWNFDLEDLKAQAALNEVDPPVKDYINKDSDISSSPFVPSLRTVVESNGCQSTGGVYLTEAEITNSAGEHANCVWPGPLPPSKPCNDFKPGHPLTGKKEPKHFGRFDVFDDDPEQDLLESCNGNGDLHNDVEKENVSTVSDTDQRIEFNHAEERVDEQDNANQKYNHRSTMAGVNDTQKDRGLQPIGKSIDDAVGLSQPSSPAKVSTGPSIFSVTCFESHYPVGMVVNTKLGDHKSQKEPSEEKLKGQAVFQKGRFSVTSQDEDIQEHGPNSRKNANIQEPPSAAASELNATTLIQTLQTLLSQTALQQELIVNLLNSVNPSEQPLSQKLSSLTAKNISRNMGLISLESKMEMISDGERNLLSQVGELQCRVTVLLEELRVVKLRNVQLERQLNAIFNKEEEERIRIEEAAKE